MTQPAIDQDKINEIRDAIDEVVDEWLTAIREVMAERGVTMADTDYAQRELRERFNALAAKADPNEWAAEYQNLQQELGPERTAEQMRLMLERQMRGQEG